jgi:septum formation protein
MKNLILASKSIRRQKILSILGIDFECIEPEEVELYEISDPYEMVREYAKLKAFSIKDKVDDVVILSADTLVVCDPIKMGKPKDEEEAYWMLLNLSGKMHRVMTGVYVEDLAEGKSVSDVEVTNVYFRDISPQEIESYIEKENVFDKAGAYAIQGIGAIFIKRIEGCYFNVVGLPIFKVAIILEKFGFSPLINYNK